MSLTKRLGAAVILSMLASSGTAATPSPLYDRILRARQCSSNPLDQLLTCRFKISESLWFDVAGIGAPDTAVTFYKVDWDGDLYATYGVGHGCVIVKRGKQLAAEYPLEFAVAFVSPRNGKVYRTWPDCKEGM